MNNLEVKEVIKNFKFPKYNEIPNMGLFLDQTVKYINALLEPLEEFKITPAMISNYVKMDIIDNPEKKVYSRKQIAYLIYITVFKEVFSLNDIFNIFTLLKGNQYTDEIAYNYFCEEFENHLQYVFENKSNLEFVGGEVTELKKMVKNAIMSLCCKIYLTKNLKILHNGSK